MNYEQYTSSGREEHMAHPLVALVNGTNTKNNVQNFKLMVYIGTTYFNLKVGTSF